jgi:hypothetical protein
MSTFTCSFKFKHYIERKNEEVDDLFDEIELDVEGTYFQDSGNISGPPDSCYPPDEDFNYIVTADGQEFQLTEEEERKLSRIKFERLRNTKLPTMSHLTTTTIRKYLCQISS